MAPVEVTDLVVRYGALTAVNGLTFSAATGSITAVLGPNGAGKSSTLETLEGYRRPDGGSVRVLGLDPIADRAALMPRIGVMLQSGGIYPGIRVDEAARLFVAYYGESVSPVELVDRVGLRDRSKSTWRQLSGGEQQRLSLALALAGRPEVVFLDEPTAGVDVAGRQLVRSLITDLARDGVAVILTTHELDEAERLAHHVVIIDHGNLLAAGRPGELTRTEAGREIRFGAPAGLDTGSLAARLGGEVTEVTIGEYLAAVASTPANVAALTAWLAEHDLPLADLRAGRQRLEDVFLRLTATSETAAAPTGRRRRRTR